MSEEHAPSLVRWLRGPDAEAGNLGKAALTVLAVIYLTYAWLAWLLWPVLMVTLRAVVAMIGVIAFLLLMLVPGWSSRQVRYKLLWHRSRRWRLLLTETPPRWPSWGRR